MVGPAPPTHSSSLTLYLSTDMVKFSVQSRTEGGGACDLLKGVSSEVLTENRLDISNVFLLAEAKSPWFFE